MDQQDIEKEVQVSNEFDYSNIVAEVQSISYLVQYCEALYNQLIKLASNDEEKNARLKSEFKNYEYKKTFNTKFEVLIKENGNSFANLNCKNYETFNEAVNSGHLKNVDTLTIELDLTYKRGKEFSLKDYENNFKIVFKPYNIKFTRKSNHSETFMNEIENNINEILKKFRVQNSIFCTK